MAEDQRIFDGIGNTSATVTPSHELSPRPLRLRRSWRGLKQMLVEMKRLPDHAKGSHGLFRCCPLEAGEIRLLSFIPTSPEEPIECELVSVPLTPGLEYTAISYTWGERLEPTTVWINGCEVPVLKNLWWCLYYLRCHSIRHYYWIDAVCIDQANVPERNHQVELMGSIYSQATSTAVWLGLPDKELEAEFALAKDFDSETARQLSRTEKVLLLQRHWSTYLAKLANRPYWSRLWIIQEVILSSKIDLVCGTHLLSWRIIEQAYSKGGFLSWDNQGDEVFQIVDGKPRVISDCMLVVLCRDRALRQQLDAFPGPAEQLCSILAKYRSAACCDIRDRVYGLLGLVCSVKPNRQNNGLLKQVEFLKPDYSQTLEQLVLQVLGHFQESLAFSDGYSTVLQACLQLETFKSDVRQMLQDEIEIIGRPGQLPAHWTRSIEPGRLYPLVNAQAYRVGEVHLIGPTWKSLRAYQWIRAKTKCILEQWNELLSLIDSTVAKHVGMVIRDTMIRTWVSTETGLIQCDSGAAILFGGSHDTPLRLCEEGLSREEQGSFTSLLITKCPRFDEAQPSLIMLTDGSIGLGTSGTRIGDLLYEIDMSGCPLNNSQKGQIVVRPLTEKLGRIVGRACVYRRHNIRMFLTPCAQAALPEQHSGYGHVVLGPVAALSLTAEL